MMHEIPCVLPGTAFSRLGVVGSAGIGVRAKPVRGGSVIVAVDGIGRIALGVPDQRDRRPVDRHGHRAAVGGDRLELIELVGVIGLVDAEHMSSRSAELLIEAVSERALGKPKAAAPTGEPRMVRRDASRDLESDARLRGKQG